MKFLTSLPVRLLLFLVFSVFLGSFVPMEIVKGGYTASIVLMDMLMFFLPFIVFVLIFSSFLENTSISLKWVVVMILGSISSNLLALWTGYGAGIFALKIATIDTSTVSFSFQNSSLSPYFKLPLQQLLATDKAAFLALFMGFSLRLIPQEKVEKLAKVVLIIKRLVFSFVRVGFVKLLPLYIIGFGLKLGLEGTLSQVVRHLGPVFFIEWASALLYLAFFLFVISKVLKTPYKKMLLTFLPAGTVGFSTMSSAASLPLILQASEAIGKKPAFSRFSSPFLSNVHMIGDDISLVILSLFLVSFSGGEILTPWAFFLFSMSFFLAKFSCVGLPGASVLVVLPVLQEHFGFSAETLTLITTLYILQDPIGTFTNVMGTTGLVSLLSTFVQKKHKKERSPQIAG